MSALPKTSSSAEWTRADEDRLRKLWVKLCLKMEGRSEAAVRAKLARIAERSYGVWPEGLR